MLKRILIAALWLPLIALAQSYPSPTFNNLTVQGTLSVTGAPTFTLPVPVGSGGTGATTLTSHGVVLGEGTSAVHITSAGTSGQPLLSGGASADPNWGNLSVPFGGTGLTSVTQYNVAVGGSGAYAFVGPTATSGIPLVSQGSAAYPAFSTAVPAGGGTGLTTITAHGVMLGEGTNNISVVGPCSTTGQSIISQGLSADPICGYPTGTLIGVQVFTSSGTYTATTGTVSIIVEVQAPGGGGGGVSATGAGQVALAQSGSGGSYAKVRITSGFSGASVTIGATGTGGAAGTNAGTAGGTTSFGTFVSCPGGTGGSGSAAVSPPAAQSNAVLPSAPTISGATTLISTQGGPGVIAFSPGATVAFPAQGGASMMGMGSSTGSGSGGNAAGIAQNTGATAGINASAGKIIVYEYD